MTIPLQPALSLALSARCHIMTNFAQRAALVDEIVHQVCAFWIVMSLLVSPLDFSDFCTFFKCVPTVCVYRARPSSPFPNFLFSHRTVLFTHPLSVSATQTLLPLPSTAKSCPPLLATSPIAALQRERLSKSCHAPALEILQQPSHTIHVRLLVTAICTILRWVVFV